MGHRREAVRVTKETNKKEITLWIQNLNTFYSTGQSLYLVTQNHWCSIGPVVGQTINHQDKSPLSTSPGLLCLLSWLFFTSLYPFMASNPKNWNHKYISRTGLNWYWLSDTTLLGQGLEGDCGLSVYLYFIYYCALQSISVFPQQPAWSVELKNNDDMTTIVGLELTFILVCPCFWCCSITLHIPPPEMKPRLLEFQSRTRASDPGSGGGPTKNWSIRPGF